MILVDYSNVMMACLSIELKLNGTTTGTDLIMGKIRYFNKEFRDKYGELILASDAKRPWRHDHFEYYKCRRRKKDYDDDHLDLLEKRGSFFKLANEFSPYRCIEVDTYEGDDVIAVLSDLPGTHVVISADKDLTQLKSSRIDIYNPIKQEFVDNGPDFLKMLIISGDAGDDIPNILSDDDTFDNPTKRQRPLTAKIKNPLLESIDPFYEIDDLPPVNGISTEDIKINYERNKKLVDLTNFDDTFKEPVMREFKAQAGKDNNLRKFLLETQCSQYITNLGDFKKGKEYD